MMYNEQMEVGEIVNRSSCTTEWKISNFQSWEFFTCFHSPKFTAMGVIWHLEVHRDRVDFGSHIAVSLYLVKKSTVLNSNILFKGAFIKSNGKKLVVFSEYFNQNKNENRCRKLLFFEKSELLQVQRSFVPEDTVSICCVFKIRELPPEISFFPEDTMKIGDVFKNQVLPQIQVKLVSDDTQGLGCVFKNQTEQASKPESWNDTEKHKGKDSDKIYVFHLTTDKEKHKGKDSDKKDKTNVFHGTTDFETLSRDFKCLLLTGEDSDLTVKVNGRKFHVHKLVLSARSPVFASMLKHGMKEKSTGVVDINDITAEAFNDFLLYLYSGNIEEFSREKIFDLYSASHKYNVKELKNACVNFMAEDLSIDTFCDILSIALLYEESVLLEIVSKFFTKHLKKIIITVKWQTFIKENPIEANELYIKALNKILPD